MGDLLQSFRENWQQKQFAAPSQKILLAASGGVDSMVLAHLLHEAQIPFAIAHCNFQLRAEASDLDETLVRQWAEERNIRLFHTRFETKQMMEEWKKGLEETARILRYEWFDEIRRDNGFAYIATAHHANDNMETLLMNLFKGTGIAGLHGIREHTDTLIRPLLFAQKEEIRSYAHEYNIPYREDASNGTDVHLRNAVRLHIIPAIEKWFPNAAEQTNASIQRFAQAEILYRRSVEAERKKLVAQRGKDFYIPVRRLARAQPLETLCYELLQPFGFSPAQTSQVLNLLNTESGHYVSSATHRIIRNRDFLVITQHAGEHTDLILVEGVPCVVHTEGASFHFSVKPKPEVLPTDQDTACIDLKLLEFPLILRRWKTGDYFYPLGMGMKKKKISKYFIDQKLAIHEKERAWVLECNKRIVWLTGMRLDERFKVKPGTHQVLWIERKKKD
ncbi:tRNA lysidine(34) synthetase TilS [Chitinophagaceae bacterium MMS25-I14]